MASPRLLTLAAALGLAACTPYSLSPPARVLPLESPATLEEGAASVEVAGGVHEGLHRPAGFGAVALAYAPAQGVQLSVDGNYAYVDYPDERSPHLGAAHVGLKLAPVEHLSFVTGVGAGSGAHGAFVAPDAGVIAGYENEYFVPWAALRGFVSLPIDPQAVTVSRPSGDGVEYFTLVPPNTIGWQVSTGFRVPVPIDDRTRVDLLGGVGLTFLYSIDGSTPGDYFFTASLGARMVFGP